MPYKNGVRISVDQWRKENLVEYQIPTGSPTTPPQGAEPEPAVEPAPVTIPAKTTKGKRAAIAKATGVEIEEAE